MGNGIFKFESLSAVNGATAQTLTGAATWMDGFSGSHQPAQVASSSIVMLLASRPGIYIEQVGLECCRYLHSSHMYSVAAPSGNQNGMYAPSLVNYQPEHVDPVHLVGV
jgi:hypothetical protein